MKPAPIATPFWTRTPTALLSVCLGLVGAGLAWRAAARILDAPVMIGEAWIGAALGIFALCGGLYLRKATVIAGALRRDLALPAGRGAVSAGSMTLILAGAALEPLAPASAGALWAAGVALHLTLAALLLRVLADMPRDGRPATASLFVPLVGQIAAPVGGVALGFAALSAALFWLAIAVWLFLTPLILLRLATAEAPVPALRPATFILLAPPSIGLVAYDRLYPGGPLTVPLFAAACVALAGLALRCRWLTAGGWNPGWGAFTFPSASFAGACLVMAERNLGVGWDRFAAFALAGASLTTLYVAWRTAHAWATGALAPAPTQLPLSAPQQR
jgi:tellurite resistance protein